MRKNVTLRDGGKVLIRSMTRDDVDMSHAFFKSLSEEDRAYLRTDVTRKEIVERRIRAMESGTVQRLVAVTDDRIVADGSLILDPFEWKKHIGEIRLIVADAYQRRGLGTLMSRELYALAAAARVEEIIVKMMPPQVAAISIFDRLGFQEHARLSDYVKDISGSRQDLIVMRCNLENLWRKLEDYMAQSDWQRSR